MDAIGVALAIPAVLMANVLYAGFVRFGIARLPGLWSPLLWVSRGVLALAICDFALVALLGAVSVPTLVGPTYWIGHSIVFFAGAPSFAHVLMLPPGKSWFKRWYLTAGVCAAFGVLFVFFEVGVGEALFGLDGDTGPFS